MKNLLPVVALFIVLACTACKKTGNGSNGTTPASADSIPADPTVASTVGFFMNHWQPRNFTAGATVAQNGTTNPATATVTVNTGQVITKIAPTFWGNNSNLWCGQLHQQPVLMQHLTNFQPVILRGPAGSVSDIFFFNRNENQAPADVPDSLLNAQGQKQAAGYWYGKNTQNWTFSIDGYYSMLQQTGSVGMLTVNYGYARYGLSSRPVTAAAHLAADWVRYDRGRTRYWEIGNEVFGEWEAGYRINIHTNLDGQPEIVTGALYGQHFKEFADSMRAAAAETGAVIYIGAVLYDSAPAGWNTSTIQNWNTGVFANAGSSADFFSVHNYFTPYQQNTSSAAILATATQVPSTMFSYIGNGFSNAALGKKPVAITEWNLFASGTRQNVSAVAGIHSVIAIGEMMKQGYGAALRWDLANAWDNGDDHGLFNKGDEPGVAAWNPRPAFYYMYYLRKFLGDRLLPATVTGNSNLYTIASSFSSGQKSVVLVNTGTTAVTAEVKFQYFTPGAKYYYVQLLPGSDHAEFSRIVKIKGEGPANGVSGGPADTYTQIPLYATAASQGIKVLLPARSVIFLVADKRN